MATKKQDRYELRGVSSSKNDVHKAIKNLSAGIFPRAFCKVLPDVMGHNKNYCNISHADGAGTKSSLAYAYWRETGDMSVWKGIAQDALVMNLDDLICVGAGMHGEEFLYSLSIDRNKALVPGEVITAIIEGTQELIDRLAALGIKIHFAGGETADVGDLVRTITVNGTMTVRMKRDRVIVANPSSGLVVLALASYGKSTYEDEYNSGIRSNGLTSARHDVFSKKVGKAYPETFSPETDPELIYSGNHSLTDIVPETDITFGKFVLSPTRTYAPILLQVFKEFPEAAIRAIIHCSGGGLTKVMRFIPEDVEVVKDSLLPEPQLFSLIPGSPKEAVRTFNLGHGMEIYCSGTTAQRIIAIAKTFDVKAKVIGRCQKRAGKNKLTIRSSHGKFVFP